MAMGVSAAHITLFVNSFLYNDEFWLGSRYSSARDRNIWPHVSNVAYLVPPVFKDGVVGCCLRFETEIRKSKKEPHRKRDGTLYACHEESLVV